MLACLMGLLAVTVFPIASSNNPGQVIITLVLPENIFQDRPFLIKILSCTYIGIVGFFGAIPVFQAFAYITAVFYEAKCLLKRG